MRTLIKNATCVLPGSIAHHDVLIENEKILGIDPPQSSQVDETVDAGGLHLIPGVIDDQVHLREPGLTHKEDLHSGSLAAARGGVTSFLEMPNTIPAATDMTRLEEKLNIARSKCHVNYGFYIGATCDNLDQLKKARRTPGIKIFIGSSTGDLLVDDQDALERIFAETSLPVCAHCEDEATVQENRSRLPENPPYRAHSAVRDHRAAVVATGRAIDLATRHNKRFHLLHVSTADEIELVRHARGLVTAEVCPHHLYFNEDDYEKLGALVQMNPSVKTAGDNHALWQALADCTIQVVATDHAPHTLEEKKRPYPESPSGVPALENSLALMLDAVNRGIISLGRVVEAMCEAPALVWDIVNKGEIKDGYDADLVLVDMNEEREIIGREQLTRCRWSPWEGWKLRGWPVTTWVMGQKVYSRGILDQRVLGGEIEYEHERGGYWHKM